MSMLNTYIYQRDLSGNRVDLPVCYEVQSHSCQALGGNKAARITITSGNRFAIWDHIELLRCPVELYNDRGECVWWGIIYEVEIVENAISIGVSLESMSNDVAVLYSLIEAGTHSAGQRRITAHASNADSVAEYGYKELQLAGGGMTAVAADQLRDTHLAAVKYPIPVRGVQAGGRSSAKATLHCVGLWQLLAWRFYTNIATTSVITTSQIEAMITAYNQFFTGVDIETASGVAQSQQRDGDQTVLEEVRALLETGTTNDRRLLAEVTQSRRLRVYEEPASGVSDYWQLRDGSLRTQYDTELPQSACVAGVWARLKDVVPASVDIVKLANPAFAFIEEMEYFPVSGERRVRFRNQRDPFAFSSSDERERNKAIALGLINRSFSYMTLAAGESLTIPVGQQLIISSEYTIDGSLTVDGELIIL